MQTYYASGLKAFVCQSPQSKWIHEVKLSKNPSCWLLEVDET
jgi:hypothetical protein